MSHNQKAHWVATQNVSEGILMNQHRAMLTNNIEDIVLMLATACPMSVADVAHRNSVCVCDIGVAAALNIKNLTNHTIKTIKSTQ